MTRPAPRSAPRRRLRTRLALLHAGLAFACGALVVAFVGVPLIVAGNTTHKPATGQPTGAQTTGNLAEVLRYSAVALAVVAGLSIVIGWLIAGRALRHLRLITTAARTVSADSLDNRLRDKSGSGGTPIGMFSRSRAKTAREA